jgi:hypothetical protein
MSESSVKSEIRNPETTTATQTDPVQTPAVPAAQSAPQEVQEGAEAAAEQAGVDEAAQREAAEKIAKAAGKAFRSGEKALRTGMLEAGRLSAEYINARLAMPNGKREVAVQRLELEFAPWSDVKVDVSRLVRTYEGYRLLAVEQDLAKQADTVPYSRYRDQWAKLVERDASVRGEQYMLLPGLEAECKAAFAKALADDLATTEVADMVSALVRDHAKHQQAAKDAELAVSKAKDAAEREATAKAAAELRAAEVAAKAAEDAKREADNEQTRAAAAAATEEWKAKQRAMVEQQAKAEQAERERKAAEARKAAEDKRLEREAAKAAAKAKKREQAARLAEQADAEDEDDDDAPTGTTVRGNILRTNAVSPTVNLKDAAKAGGMKQAAEWAAELVVHCEAPDDAFESLLRMLKASGELSKTSKRAIDAALVVLTRKAGPSPVELAGAAGSTNGAVALAK